MGSGGRKPEVPAELGQGKQFCLLHKASLATLRCQPPSLARTVWPSLRHVPDPEIALKPVHLSYSPPPLQPRPLPSPAWTATTAPDWPLCPSSPLPHLSGQNKYSLLTVWMLVLLPLQPHSSHLGLYSAFWKHLHLPKSTHCPTSSWLLAITLLLPKTLFSAHNLSLYLATSGISLARHLFLQKDFPCHRLSSMSSCGCTQPPSFLYQSTYHCGTTTCRKL